MQLAALADADPGQRRPVAAPGQVDGEGPPQAESKARNLPVGDVIIDRRRRGESSVEETLLEIYQAGLSVQQAERIVDALWGSRLDLASVCTLGRKIARSIDAWRNRPIRGRHIYVSLTAVELKRNWGSGCRMVSVLVAVGVNAEGIREVLGVIAGDRDDRTTWREFLRSLQKRGLNGVKLFIGDQLPGVASEITELFPEAAYQHCVLQFYRSVLSLAPAAQMPTVEGLLKTIHASGDRATARARAAQIESTMRLMSLPFVAVAIAEYVEATLTYYAFPAAHWRRLRSNYLLNRIMRDIRERARVVGAFSDGPSAVLLVSARLRHVADQCWSRRHLAARQLRDVLAADIRSGAV